MHFLREEKTLKMLPSISITMSCACLLLATLQICAVSSLAQLPADHLVPPPLPTPQRLTHSFAHAQTDTLRPPPPPAAPALSASETPGPGFMTRIARWFGFGGAPPSSAPREQLLSPSSHSYAYPKPGHGQDGKPCSLCNKYPWVPMLHHQKAQTSWQQPALGPPQEAQAAASHHRQRAVQFQVPQQSLFLPIHVPGAGLPLFNAQPFRPLGTSSSSSSSSSSVQSAAATAALPFTSQQLPTTQPAHFAENVGAYSEQRPDRVPHVQPSSTSSNFEIVKSHQVTDFVTSVEYPATYVQSHAIDLGTEQVAALPLNHKQPDSTEISTVRYQLEDLSSSSLNQHAPASQLLTELGHFTPDYEAQTQTPPTPTQYYESLPADNYPAASSQQLQHHHHQQQQQQQQQQHLQHQQQLQLQQHLQHQQQLQLQQHLQHQQQQQQQEQQQVLHYAPWTTTAAPDLYAETQPTSSVTPAGSSTLYDQLEFSTQQPAPAVELTNHLAGLAERLRAHARQTPKRLLDAPIKYGPHVGVLAGPPPRPFTRDPAELSFRVSQKPAQLPAASFAVTQEPTPTSTYGAIDASGHYAGMSPPQPVQLQNPQQVIIPYTTKNKPRPFEPTRLSGWTPALPALAALPVGGHSNDVELHEQQESKLVSTATAPPPPNTRRTTKYLTKILASNLRELLKRERETKGRPLSMPLGFDISKLQHNIDGWTEQEYTSLSHRPSTPTIRGRSKHIPSEYLTTTTTTPAPLTPTKSTSLGFELGATSSDAGDLPISINNLEQRGGKRFQYVAPIEDNRLLEFYEAQQRVTHTTSRTPVVTATAATAATASSTAGAASTATAMPLILMSSSSGTPDGDNVTPLYVRSQAATLPPTELWKKAKVAILPQTNEKVYVVTPQPRYMQHRSETETETSTLPSPVYESRFAVRPTPAAAISDASAATPVSTHQQNYTPDIFGLMGLSAYVPADPVEIIDGNSKVITTATPAPTAASQPRAMRLNAKPIMEPLPR